MSGVSIAYGRRAFALLFMSACLLAGRGAAAGDIEGFQVDSIQGLDDLDLDNRIGRTAGAEEHIINQSDCQAYLGGQIEVAWSYTIPVGADDSYMAKLSGPDKTCSANDWEAGECQILVDDGDATVAADRVFTIDMADILGDTCALGSSYTVRVYIVLFDNLGDTYYSEQIAFTVDLEPPDPPLITEIEAGEGGLRVTLENPDSVGEDDDVRYELHWAQNEFSSPDDAGVSSSGSFSTSSYKISGLSDGQWYYVRATTFDENDNESALSTPVMGQPQPVTDFFEAYKDAGGGEPGGFCFVATAAYGTPLHPFVDTLRRFRDGWLMQSAWGRDFVAWYYENSPPLARFIRTHPLLRLVVQVALVPLVVGAWFLVDVPPVGQLALVLAFWLAATQWRRRRLALPALPWAFRRGGVR